MVSIDEELMDVDLTPQRKRKVPAKEDLFANGKRTKFESFPKATSKLTVSAASATLTQDEDVDRCKKIFLF